ncbi:MAG: PaaI family thioesterase [Atopobiaceae bacterium]|nr:PaaI family thioesterase [Atopobiaceae bacterium]MBR1829970.1 PaaI family thioesterase [Atopobiaceae bacterium]
MLDENSSLEDVRVFFANDRFATDACGCEVLEAAHGHSACAFTIGPQHINAQGNVMGGAIFTLADFALAVACNVGEKPTVSVQSSIEYFNMAKGARLIATAEADKSGRNLGFYTVDIADDLGTHVARMTATCFRRA